MCALSACTGATSHRRSCYASRPTACGPIRSYYNAALRTGYLSLSIRTAVAVDDRHYPHFTLHFNLHFARCLSSSRAACMPSQVLLLEC